MQAALHIIPTFMWWELIDFIDISSMIIIYLSIYRLSVSMVFQIILHDHQIETIRTSSLARRNWLTTCSSWTKTMRLTISFSSGKWEDYQYYHQHWWFVQNPKAILLIGLGVFVWITMMLTKDKRYWCHQACKGLHIFMTGAVSWVRGAMLLIVLDDKSSNDKRYLCYQAWDCISLWPVLFPWFTYSYSFSCCFQGTGEFINTRFFCRVCALMHNTQVCTHQYDIGQLVLILIISVSWFSSSLSRSVGSHHHYLGHHLNDFKSYFSYFWHTPYLRVFGPSL